MKLATFRRSEGQTSIGVVDASRQTVTDLFVALEGDARFESMQSLIESGPSALDLARDVEARPPEEAELPLASVRLLVPVPRPIQMRDAMTFPLHIRQAMRGLELLGAKDASDYQAISSAPLRELPQVYRTTPIWYFTNHLCVAGPGSEVRWPAYSERRDFELELGIFTWGAASDIRESEAAAHIFGYTIFNDLSARDQQSKETPGMLGPGKGKSFNGSNVLGPWIVTPDEIGNPYDLKTWAKVNGEVWSTGHTAGMLFSLEELLASLSRSETIHAGEFIGSGTVENGCGLELRRFLERGDHIELEIERI